MFCAGVWCSVYATVLLCILGAASEEGNVVGIIGIGINGSSLPPSFELDDDNFFLNLAGRANSSGFISSVDYCYAARISRSTQDRIDAGETVVFQATVGIYRPNPSDEILELVRSFVVEIPSDLAIEDRFTCGFTWIPPTAVEVGDVFGVCSRNDEDSGVRRLIFIADTDNDDDVIMGGVLCETIGEVPNMVVVDDLRNRDERVLLITANIDSMEPEENFVTTPPINATDEAEAATENATVLMMIDNEVLIIAILVSVIVPAILMVLCLIAVLVVRAKIGQKRVTARQNIYHSQSLVYYNVNSAMVNFPTVPYQQEPVPVVLSVATNLEGSADYEHSRLTSSHAVQSYCSEDNHDSVADELDEETNSMYDDIEVAYDLPQPYPYEDPIELTQHKLPQKNTTHPLNWKTISLLSNLLEMNQDQDIYSGVSPYSAPADKEAELYHQMKLMGLRSIRRDALECVGHLGMGQFGSVEKAHWHWRKIKVNVALKSLNGKSLGELDTIKFLQEAVLMAQFRHPNIISLYGAVVIGEPVILVMELASKGDLLNVLMSTRPDPGQLVSAGLSKTLLTYSQQIALGMQYLSSKRFIHRDLAARNILLSADNICKIADFGMSRDLEDTDYYISQGGIIPVKWTAPEALRRKKYSTASDVWSYGCVLYEIWSLGYKPFSNKSNIEVISLIASGERLHAPPGCPKEIYRLMLKSWREGPNERPNFRAIVNSLVCDGVLYIPPEEVEQHPQSCKLGGVPLDEAKLYKSLRLQYIG